MGIQPAISTYGLGRSERVGKGGLGQPIELRIVEISKVNNDFFNIWGSTATPKFWSMLRPCNVLAALLFS